MDIKLVQRLREISGAGVLDCQEALRQTKENFDDAAEFLRKKGQKIAQNKEIRAVSEGIIESYVHTNSKIGVLIEVLCETDFVARNEEFKELAHDLALQVAATNPKWVSPDQVPESVIEKEKEIYGEGLDSEKPTEVREKIINGKLEKFYQDVCLLSQPFIKDDKMIVKDLIQGVAAKLGENIQVGRFIRFAL